MPISKLLTNLAIIFFLCAFVRYVYVWIFANNLEPFSNLESSSFNFNHKTKHGMKTDISPLLSDVYPTINRNQVSNKNSDKLWWYYPSFGVGSFKQITNNIKYPNNPDNGTCSPGLFCGTFYKDAQQKSNISVPLKPVKYGDGARVNFYRNDKYLLQFNNKDNILY